MLRFDYRAAVICPDGCIAVIIQIITAIYLLTCRNQ